MNIQKGTAQNDKAIFSSITSLMKAQAYELGSLPQRKKENCVYQFNLISIVDSSLVRLHFEGASIKGCEVNDEHYIAGYIIKKEQTSARIHFVRAEAFSGILQEYNLLHDVNASYFTAVHNQFFNQILKDDRKLDLFEEELLKVLSRQIASKADLYIKKLFVFGTPKEESINIWIPDLDKEQIEFLNTNAFVVSSTKEALRKLYRYDGKFRFIDIPF